MDTRQASDALAHIHMPQRGFLVLLLAGLAAAYGGWLYVDRYFLYEDPLPDDLVRILLSDPANEPVVAQRRGEARARPTQTAEQRAELANARVERFQHYWRSQVKQSGLAFGIFGGLLGASLALADSLFRRSFSGLMVATLGAATLGAAFGAGGGIAARFALNPLFFRSGQHPMVVSILVHMVCWSVLALGIGLSFRWGRGGPREALRNAFACALGGILAAMLFTPICSYLMPLDSTVPLVPENANPRLLWLVLAGTAIATFPAIVATRPAPALIPVQ